jgi:hypothetical protein
MTFGRSTGLRTDGKAWAKLARAEFTRKTAEIMWLGMEGAPIPDPGTIRDDLLSSIAISWSCKSSVMEMTKNNMIKAQPIATIFRQLLASRSGQAAARDRFLHSSPIPTTATHAQTRFSASSMVSKISYATSLPDAITFHPDRTINYVRAPTKQAASANSNRMEEAWLKRGADPRAALCFVA